MLYGLIIDSYINISDVCKNTITKLTEFMNLLIPLVLSLLVANGTIVAAGMMKPVVLLMISFINVLISKILLPVTFLPLIMNVIGNISENIKFSKLPKVIQKISLTFLKCTLAIFIGILSIEGTLAANVDGFTAKTTKAIVSTTIPVVGKALSDAADSVIGATSITKNAIGVLGIIVIFIIAIEPLLKLFVLMIAFDIAGGLMEPFADKRISNCMSLTSNSIKMLLALLAVISIMFILAISMMIKISNFSLMYS